MPRSVPDPSRWGFAVGADGALALGSQAVDALVRRYGSPLHVVDVRGLAETGRRLSDAFQRHHTGDVRIFFAVKSNPVCGVVGFLADIGYGAEVISPYELGLAERAGVAADRIVVNGPAKTLAFIEQCVASRVWLLVADSVEELRTIDAVCQRLQRSQRVALRLNLAYGVAEKVSAASCVFGVSLGAELEQALAAVQRSQHLDMRGFHAHIGSGHRGPRALVHALGEVFQAVDQARDRGVVTDVIDIGGGIGVRTVKDYNVMELMLYHGVGRLPSPPSETDQLGFDGFAKQVASAIRSHSDARGLAVPTLVLEPGRCVSGPNQHLCLQVRGIKRRGRTCWALTDGGCFQAFPTSMEYHEVFSCRDPLGARTHRYEIIGSGCHPTDHIVRAKKMPPLRVGDTLVVMDAGAYFTSSEGNFSFPRPGVVAVDTRDGSTHVLRAVESIDDMLARELALE